MANILSFEQGMAAFSLPACALESPPMARTARLGVALRAAVFVSFVIAAAGGCTSVNRRLNAPGVLIERQVHNRTRAVTGVAATPTSSRDPRGVRAEGAPPYVSPDVHPDGCFVGLALSGGGSR